MLISILFLQGIYICSCKQIMGQFVFHLIYLCICSGLSVALLFSSRPQWLTVVHTWEFTYVIYIIKNSKSFNSLLIPKFLSAAIAWLWWLRDKKNYVYAFRFLIFQIGSVKAISWLWWPAGTVASRASQPAVAGSAGRPQWWTAPTSSAHHAAARPLQGGDKQCPPESLFPICVDRISGAAEVSRICGEMRAKRLGSVRVLSPWNPFVDFMVCRRRRARLRANWWMRRIPVPCRCTWSGITRSCRMCSTSSRSLRWDTT